MSTTTQVPTTITRPAGRVAGARSTSAKAQPVWKNGVAATAVAAVATTTLAAAASAAGVSFADRTGESIPIPGFATLTIVFSLVGVVMAAGMARRARTPHATFVRTALVLVALSFVPDLTFGFDVASAATLIALHTVAALIVVPALAGRLARTR
jgi:hypothetical protein